MIVKDILLANEAYTHKGWGYENLCVGFSRLYYILDGEAYYREHGKEAIRLRKNHLYLTPVRTGMDFYENPNDKLNHMFLHITTNPPVTELVEVEVKEGTLLFDAVALLRKYIGITDEESKRRIVELVLSCLEIQENDVYGAAKRTKAYLEKVDLRSFDIRALPRAVGYSREYLARCFFAAYRTTPYRYFQLLKMCRAKEWLLSGVRVGEVAERVGYATPYSFSKAFKEKYGISPKAMQKEQA